MCQQISLDEGEEEQMYVKICGNKWAKGIRTIIAARQGTIIAARQGSID